MRRGSRWKYAVGVAVLVAVAAVLFAAFSLMSRTNREEIYLSDTQDERFGWSYELLVDGEARPYELAFEDDGFTPALPEGTQAVRVRRTMTEEIPGAELAWYCGKEGVELSLNGAILHSDFAEARRGADGFLRPTREEWAQLMVADARRVRMTMPEDYLGGELCFTTYFPEGCAHLSPVFPILCSEESDVADRVVYSVKHDALMTGYALLALLIAVLFLLDIPNDGSDGKLLLLSLYFLLQFVDEASCSYAGFYSMLSEYVDTGMLYVQYVAPLYLYLALQLKRRWRYPLCGAVLLWTAYGTVRRFLVIRSGLGDAAGTMGPGRLALLLAVAAACCVELAGRGRRNPRERRRLAIYGAATVAVAVACVFAQARAWGGLGDYLRDGVGVALRMGNFEPLVSLITGIASVMVPAAVVLEFVRRTLRTRREMGVLEDRARRTLESYEHLLAAESATNALRHEVRHHLTALSGILEGGDLQRASRYVTALAGDIDQLPVGRYSQNLLVNVIAGSFLDRARGEWIRVEHRLNVPPELAIADEDLSVFLSNMLQNALEACERMDPEEDRYIRVDMGLRGKFLFFRCANSAPRDAEAPESSPDHGYGLAAMRRIAEKYESVLVIERTPGEFLVKSDFCLKGDAPHPAGAAQ